MPSVEEELARRLAAGGEGVVATVIKLDGEPPSQPGAKLLMACEAAIAGTLRCTELEPLPPLKPRSIGLVGSRRHPRHHLEALRAKGVPEAVIGRIQSPVGLDLGAKTPEEIALSILAGLVAIRRGGQAGWKSRNG